MRLFCFKQVIIVICGMAVAGCSHPATEAHRPAFHFSPRSNWMNDPNGMYYHDGVYHLFFQHYPEATHWGPMHWGHATSPDMINWKEEPIALYPDSLGYIFSGSAVVDIHNTSGFGKDGQVPVVAVYTNHDPAGEREKRTDYQTQSIAYSLDNGKSWTKYAGNPVVKNPGIVDFRDPKVMWYDPLKKWIMTLATKDRITFYSSSDLKEWHKESEFGETLGAHGGVWECPDLLRLDHEGKEVWALLVSINPGAPNGGSGTQYFLGEFDGHAFSPADTLVRWLDLGTDNYAGVTFSNTGNRTILMGWMSNWQYAQAVPTEKFRSAMTLPRELGLKSAGNRLYLTSTPVKEVGGLSGRAEVLNKVTVDKSYTVTSGGRGLFDLELRDVPAENFSISLGNSKGEELIIGYDKASNRYYIDRTRSGNTGFEPGFGKVHAAPRLAGGNRINLRLVADVASVELFADDGLNAMTDIFFPGEPYSKITITAPDILVIGTLKFSEMKPARLR